MCYLTPGVPQILLPLPWVMCRWVVDWKRDEEPEGRQSWWSGTRQGFRKFASTHSSSPGFRGVGYQLLCATANSGRELVIFTSALLTFPGCWLLYVRCTSFRVDEPWPRWFIFHGALDWVLFFYLFVFLFLSFLFFFIYFFPQQGNK